MNGRMSALGTKRTIQPHPRLSATGVTADIGGFCKIIEYQWVQGKWFWFGKRDVFCAAKWLPNENYMDPDFTKIGTEIKCDYFSGTYGYAVAFQGNMDAHSFVTGRIKD